MKDCALNWINLCPVNFVKLALILDQTDDINAAVLYMRLLYTIRGSKLKNKQGEVCITRTLDTMAKWLNCKSAKISKLLKKLVSLNLLQVKAGLWYGKKQLFISAPQVNLEALPLNVRILEQLNAQTGSIEGAILLGLIAFRLNRTILHQKNEDWCSLTRLELSKILHLSLGTIDKHIQNLADKNLIQVESRVFKQQRRLHFSIPFTVYSELHSKLNENSQNLPIKNQDNAIPPLHMPKIVGGNDAVFSLAEPTLGLNLALMLHTVEAFIQVLAAESIEQTPFFEPEYIFKKEEGALLINQKQHKKETPNPVFCRSPQEEPSKNAAPIRISTQLNKVNNITPYSLKKRSSQYLVQNNITFNAIGENLSKEQVRYLQKVLEQTITNAKLNVSSKETLYQELSFSILNPQQHQGLSSFKHIVHRCMKLLREKNWRTPKGFHRYSAYGQSLSTYREAQLKAHEGYKQASGALNSGAPYGRATIGHYITDKNEIIFEKSPPITKTPLSSYSDRLTGFALNEVKEIIALRQTPPLTDSQTVIMGKIVQRLSRIKNFVVLGANEARINHYLSEYSHSTFCQQ